MLRFLLPAFALTGALLVLFAGAISDLHPWSTGIPATPFSPPASTAPDLAPPQPQADLQRPSATNPGAEQQQANRQQPAPEPSTGQVEALQQQAAALQQQLAQRAQELQQRTQELQQRTRDVQQAQAEADRLRDGKDSSGQRRETDEVKPPQPTTRSSELNQRSQELEARKRDLDQRSRDAAPAPAEAERLRQVIEALRQQKQNRTEPATSPRQKAEDAPAARQKAKQQQSAATPPQDAPSSSPGRSSETGAPTQQLVTAKQWLAAGRPDEARRLLATAQTQVVFQPVTPDSPDAQGGSVPATEIGNAIRWLDAGANRQAMQAINRAIDATTSPAARVRAWSGYQADSSSGYSQPFTPRYYSNDAVR